MRVRLPLLAVLFFAPALQGQSVADAYPGYSVEEVVRFNLYLAGMEVDREFRDGDVGEGPIRSRIRDAVAGMGELLERGRIAPTEPLVESMDRLRWVADSAYIGPVEASCDGGPCRPTDQFDPQRYDSNTLRHLYRAIPAFEWALRDAGTTDRPVRHTFSGSLDACMSGGEMDEYTTLQPHWLSPQRSFEMGGGEPARGPDGRALDFRVREGAVGFSLWYRRACWVARPMVEDTERFEAFRAEFGAPAGDSATDEPGQPRAGGE